MYRVSQKHLTLYETEYHFKGKQKFLLTLVDTLHVCENLCFSLLFEYDTV